MKWNGIKKNNGPSFHVDLQCSIYNSLLSCVCINMLHQNGLTALHYASVRNFADVCRVLLRHNASSTIAVNVCFHVRPPCLGPICMLWFLCNLYSLVLFSFSFSFYLTSFFFFFFLFNRVLKHHSLVQPQTVTVTFARLLSVMAPLPMCVERKRDSGCAHKCYLDLDFGFIIYI